jgi:hypothetical protein
MSGEAALTKIKLRTKSWLDGGAIGATTEIDRPFDRSFGDDELETPVVNIRCPRTSYELQGYENAWLHEAQVMFDIVTRSSTLSTIDDRQSLIAANIVARLAARDPSQSGTIGECLIFCDPVAMGDSSEEGNMSDHGVMTLAYRMAWMTPAKDFITINGTSGQTIT